MRSYTLTTPKQGRYRVRETIFITQMMTRKITLHQQHTRVVGCSRPLYDSQTTTKHHQPAATTSVTTTQRVGPVG